MSDHVGSSPKMWIPTSMSNHVGSSLGIGTRTGMSDHVALIGNWNTIRWRSVDEGVDSTSSIMRGSVRNRRDPHQESKRLWPPPELEGERSKWILIQGTWGTKLGSKWKWSAREKPTRKVSGVTPTKTGKVSDRNQSSPKPWWKIIPRNHDNDNDDNERACKVVLMTMKVGWSSIWWRQQEVLKMMMSNMRKWRRWWWGSVSSDDGVLPCAIKETYKMSCSWCFFDVLPCHQTLVLI